MSRSVLPESGRARRGIRTAWLPCCCSRSRSPQSVPTSAERVAAKAIDAASIRANIRFLSSDLLEGRAPGTRGDALTQSYLATQFEQLGLKPALANGSYLQRFDLVGVEGHPPELTFVGPKPGAKATFQASTDFMAVSGRQAAETRLDAAELVFVGYGIQAPEYQWDDYKGLDVRGKVLVMMNSDPADDPKLFAGKARLYYGRWDYKYEIANQLGAAGVLDHPHHAVGRLPVAGRADLVGGGAVRRLARGRGAPAPGPRAGSPRTRAARSSRSPARTSTRSGPSPRRREFKPVPLGVTLSTRFANEVTKKQTANVLAILPGLGPEALEGVGRLHRPPRPPRPARGREAGRGHHLQRRPGQRLGHRAAARDREGVPGAPEPAGAHDPLRGGRRRGGRAARVAVPRRAPARPGGQARRRNQRRRREHLGPHPRRDDRSGWASRASTR